MMETSSQLALLFDIFSAIDDIKIDILTESVTAQVN